MQDTNAITAEAGISPAGIKGLIVSENDLHGPIPESFTSLSLAAFHYFDTDLCEPEGPVRDWLKTIENHSGTGVSCP